MCSPAISAVNHALTSIMINPNLDGALDEVRVSTLMTDQRGLLRLTIRH